MARVCRWRAQVRGIHRIRVHGGHQQEEAVLLLPFVPRHCRCPPGRLLLRQGHPGPPTALDLFCLLRLFPPCALCIRRKPTVSAAANEANESSLLRPARLSASTDDDALQCWPRRELCCRGVVSVETQRVTCLVGLSDTLRSSRLMRVAEGNR